MTREEEKEYNIREDERKNFVKVIETELAYDWKPSIECMLPEEDGEYEVIGQELGGKVMKDTIEYCTDDGWQCGNNWDVLLWRKVKNLKKP